MRARVEDNDHPHSSSTLLASQERKQVLPNDQEIIGEDIREEVTVKKEVRKAFSGSIIERF